MFHQHPHIELRLAKQRHEQLRRQALDSRLRRELRRERGERRRHRQREHP